MLTEQELETIRLLFMNLITESEKRRAKLDSAKQSVDHDEDLEEDLEEEKSKEEDLISEIAEILGIMCKTNRDAFMPVFHRMAPHLALFLVRVQGMVMVGCCFDGGGLFFLETL